MLYSESKLLLQVINLWNQRPFTNLVSLVSNGKESESDDKWNIF